MKFRRPAMTYIPKSMEGWEQHLSLTIVPAPFETIAPIAAGIVKVRENAIGATQGERMPPMMWLSEMQRREKSGEKGPNDPPGFPQFNGTLIWSPIEAPDVTVIEHPLDCVSGSGFPEDLARVVPDMKLTTFDSIMETARRQDHGLRIQKGRTTLRRVIATIGYDAHRWEWKEEGKPEIFENCALYKASKINARLNRSIITDYIKELGIDTEKSLFGRAFRDSLHLWPLPYAEPSASRFYCNEYDDEATKARSCGVRSNLSEELPEMFSDENFAETAGSIADLRRWESMINEARWKAGQSAERAKTDAGRLRAQLRVVEVVKQIQDEAYAAGLVSIVVRSVSKTGGLGAVMKELGKDTEAYTAFLDCYRD
jgi:hypothetical protein